MDTPEQLSLSAEIEELGARQPFLPHTIIMASGTRYEIRENDAVSVGSSLAVIIPTEGGQHLLRLTHVSEVSIEEAKS